MLEPALVSSKNLAKLAYFNPLRWALKI